MIGKWIFRTAVLVVVVAYGTAERTRAESPWAMLMSPRRVEADPNRTYTIKEENGPWTIIACTFSGEGAEKQAHDLVLELRSRYKLEAYQHKMDFKLEDPNLPNQTPGTSPRRWTYKRFKDHPNMYRGGAIEEVAVVVGNFPTVDDPEAQHVLEKLKSADPDCLNPERTKNSSRTLATLRKMQEYVASSLPSSIEGRRHHGPMAHAFVTTNPLLSSEFYAPKNGVDELVLRMNKDVEHSLLDCPSKYTVQVATFSGSVEIDQQKIQKIQSGEKNFDSNLAKAAEMAHELTLALRQKGYEAYEFHDRYRSIVTVGSFDSVNVVGPDGTPQPNPRILAIMKFFGGSPEGASPQKDGTLTVKSIIGIPFDYQPVPVEIPKRSISRELAQRLDVAGK